MVIEILRIISIMLVYYLIKTSKKFFKKNQDFYYPETGPFSCQPLVYGRYPHYEIDGQFSKKRPFLGNFFEFLGDFNLEVRRQGHITENAG